MKQLPKPEWVESVQELVADIQSGDRISVGGVHFLRAPVAALNALSIKSVDNLTYVAWGGGLPLEILLQAGAVGEAEICFSSMDIFGLAPGFRDAVETGRLRLTDLSALQLMTGLRATAENLGAEVMQTPAGSALSQTFPQTLTGQSGAPLSLVPPIAVDHLLLHAQRADDDGNVEIQGARATDLSTAFGAQRILVTVEERVRRGELGARRAFILPREFVSKLAVVPFGAYPTSCLPYYAADYAAIQTGLENFQGSRAAQPSYGIPTQAEKDAARRRAAVSFETSTAALRERPARAVGEPWSTSDLMMVLISRTVTNDSVCTFGSASPLPAAAYLLAKLTHAPDATLMSFNGGYLDIAGRPMSLSLGEQQDFESAIAHTGGDETYRWYYQGAKISHEVVGSAQIDSHGATNNLSITRSDSSKIRLPGQGGMADVANLHRDFIIYLPRQDIRNTREKVEVVSAHREWLSEAQRAEYGLQPGVVRLLTNLGVMELNEESQTLELTALHPGVDFAQFQEHTGFEVTPSPNLMVSAPPTHDELRAIRTLVDPLGVCELEFVPAKERHDLIDRILSAESAALERAAKLPQSSTTRNRA